MFLQRRWLQKLSIRVQVLNANLVALCRPYGDAYHTRSATRNTGASVQRAVVVRQAPMGRDLESPTASSSERAGGDRHLVSSGIRSS
jgi:hypothetical protein